MADDVTLSTPVGTGDTIRSKDRAGVETQIVGLDLGIGTGSEALMTGTMPVSGTVATGGLTDAQLRASAVPVDTELPAAAALANGTANPTVPGTGAFGLVWNGATWDRANQPLTDTQLRATPVPVSGTVTTTPPANQSVNVAQVAGTATDTNSGNKSAGTQRVTLATDQVQLTNALKVDGSAVTQPVSGTVTANAGTGPFPVSDNAGSLTVDAPVGTPAFVRLSDGTAAIATLPVSLATNTPDVTDRDARLAGRVKNLDIAGTVIDPALKGQLPAALVGGRLDVNIGAPATLPVSLATNTPDVTDRAAREVGRVRVWDGTDEATVLPVRTVPATTEKVQVTGELPVRLPTYQCVTAEVAPAITIGVKELLCFFHPAAVTVDVYIVEIVVSILVTTASTTGGRTNVEVLKATSAGTGGTNLAAADVGGGLGTSAVITNSAANVMQVKTGGGALGTAMIRQGVEHATQPLGSQRFEVFKASSVGNGIIMRGGSADGINIQVNRVAGHTALVDQWTASIRWIEL